MRARNAVPKVGGKAEVGHEEQDGIDPPVAVPDIIKQSYRKRALILRAEAPCAGPR